MAQLSVEIHKKLKFVNKSPNPNPQYAHDGDSGMDLRAWVRDEDANITDILGKKYISIQPFERRLIHTGIYVDLPENTEIQVRTRSGCALKQGLVVLNSPGTVDNFYRNEICVIAINLSNENIMICNGDRIAQMVLCPVYLKELVDLEEVDEINTNTERGTDGFGSTGIK